MASRRQGDSWIGHGGRRRPRRSAIEINFKTRIDHDVHGALQQQDDAALTDHDGKRILLGARSQGPTPGVQARLASRREQRGIGLIEDTLQFTRILGGEGKWRRRG